MLQKQLPSKSWLGIHNILHNHAFAGFIIYRSVARGAREIQQILMQTIFFHLKLQWCEFYFMSTFISIPPCNEIVVILNNRFLGLI